MKHLKISKVAYFFAILMMIFSLAINADAKTTKKSYDAYNSPKREFRGAWLHIIGQSQWLKMSTKEAKEYIVKELDHLQQAGCNAVIFQVRPTADAAYKSDLEPWSSWLTGRRGKAPSPLWDPMEFTIEEAHKRGMEFHAWLNPYRVSSNISSDNIPENHDSKLHPERYFKYNGMLFFDPAYQENRDFICEVVDDIMTRYDVDAIHIDDYFYPYPKSGNPFNSDAASYAKFGNGMNKGDWRRHNVDLLIEQLHHSMRENKPWVRFGVSPFGIWRNKKSDPRGSDSNGLENYDDLYADVLLWADKGWIDYLAPQLYWELDLKVAPSRHLAEWWNNNVKGDTQLYIGQDTKRTMDKPDVKAKAPNELATKIALSRKLENVDGNVWWHGYWVADNYKGVRDALQNKHQSTIALPPSWDNLATSKGSGKAEGPKNLHIKYEDGATFLVWDSPKIHNNENDAVKFVVYSFLEGENTKDLSNPETIIALTGQTKVQISDDTKPSSIEGMHFAVTSLDRLNRESAPSYLK